ncbi:class I SAM-dependent methyltransferase [Marinospirillum insulare]|uniref:class I SAM-dependent methyltransferase n=1 Tax=Marinospirillum insulare TaxID=217169 RepID=UPI001364711C|nr:class I SAM-dependent methyltransferase [Marinospirillum insulare]
MLILYEDSLNFTASAMHLQNSDTQALKNQANSLTWQAWQKFWASHLGKEVLRVEAELLAPIMESLCGYHVLSLGSCSSKHLLASCTIKHKIEWRPSFALAEHPSCLIADPSKLPLPNDSMDVVLLHHSLEIFDRPHALLKEAARVTLPKGEMLILGFNPYSLWGLAKMLPKSLQAEPLVALKSAAFISQNKLQDWFEFLDLKQEAAQQLFHRPVCNSKKLLVRLADLDQRLDKKNWPLAGIYLLRVKKRVGSPLRPQNVQKSTHWLTNQPVASPTRTSLKTEK